TYALAGTVAETQRGCWLGKLFPLPLTAVPSSIAGTSRPGAEKAMIESIEFTNFKALRRTALPLAPFTLLLGPNGSGKTTVLQALENIAAVTAQQGSLQRRAGMTLPWSSLR